MKDCQHFDEMTPDEQRSHLMLEHDMPTDLTYRLGAMGRVVMHVGAVEATENANG